MSFGSLIRKHREMHGVALNELARQLQISPAYWSRIERDLEKPPSDDLIKCSAWFLRVSIDDAFVDAGRLPPDMRPALGKLVRMYRKRTR